jgi:5'(3')-deoxyribonucleotidase
MPNPASKPTIAVDIDDVLAANAKGFTEYSNKKWGTTLVPDDYTEHWAQMWKIDKEEAEERAQIIHANASDIFKGYHHDAEAKHVLAELKNDFKLVIVTSRRSVIQKDTLEWINKYYPEIFDEIHFAGMWDDKTKDLDVRMKATKAELLVQIAADYLIDDQPKHCFAAAEAGIKTVLFGDYRWNRDIEVRPHVARAKTWQEVLEYFENEQG